MRIPVPHSLPIPSMLCLFYFSYSGCCSSCGFPFLWWLLICWAPFHMFIDHLAVLSFPHFSVGLAVFVFLMSKSALYNLNIGSLSDISICVLWIFSTLCDFVQCTYNLPTAWSQRCSPMIFFKNSFCFTMPKFRFAIHLGLIFVYGMREGSNWH